MELIGVKVGPNGLIWPELWPVKVLRIGARKWALQSCSGQNWSKIFTASFFSCFFGQDKLITRTIRLSSGTTDAVFSQNLPVSTENAPYNRVPGILGYKIWQHLVPHIFSDKISVPPEHAAQSVKQETPFCIKIGHVTLRASVRAMRARTRAAVT